MSTDKKQLPSVGTLFKDAWEMTSKSLLSLILLNVSAYVLYAGIAALAFILFIVSGFGSAIIKQGPTAIINSLSSLSFGGLVTIGGLLGLFVVGLIVVGSAISTAAILLIDSSGKLSIMQAVKKGLSLIIPLSFVGLLYMFLAFGGMFVFFFPGLIISFLLGFASLEVMLNNKRSVEALKRSVAMISNNFGGILIRWIALMAVYVLIAVIIPSVLGTLGKTVQLYVQILSFVINSMLGWYMLAYNIALYKEVRNTIDRKDEKSITWMWVVATIGWVIFALMVFGTWKLVTSESFQKGFKQALQNNTSSLDKLVGMNPKAKAHYDKSLQLFNEMQVNADNPTEVKRLNDENIAELKQAIEIEPNTALLWTQLGLAYMWVNSNGTLEEDAVGAFNKAEAIDPDNTIILDKYAEVLIRLEQYDEAILKLQKSLRISTADGDESGFTHYRLGLAYAGLKVNSTAIEHFEKSIEILGANNKNGTFDATILAAQKQIAALSQ